MVSIFASINSSSKKIGEKTIYEVLGMIKDHPHRAEIDRVKHKKNSENKRARDIWSFGKKEKKLWNDYEYVKHMKVPVVTWGISVAKKRRKQDIEDADLSGYIYYDIDEFNGCGLEEVFAYLSDRGLKEVVAVWRSLSGGGLGFLVKINGLTKENFKSNFFYNKDRFEAHFSSLNKGKSFTIDNLNDYTRVNVIPSDPDIFIRDEESIYVIPAIQSYGEEKKYSKIDVKFDTRTPFSIENMHLSYLVEKAMGVGGAYSSTENRPTYVFFREYFSNSNICGITLESAMAFLQENHSGLLSRKYGPNEVFGFGDHIYKSYEKDFGSFIKTYEEPQGYKLANYNQEYSDDPQKNEALLTKIYFDLKNHDREFNANFVFLFALRAKQKGILYRYATTYANKWHWDEAYLAVIRDVYANPWKLFGIVLQENETEKKINEYVSDPNYNIVRENGTAAIKQVADSMSFYRKNSLHDFMWGFTLKFISFGFDPATIKAELKKTIENHALVDVYVDEIHQQYSWRLGIRRIRKNTPPPQATERTTVIPNQKYISDLGIDLPEENTIIWSDTGTGKTQWITKNPHKAIICVPTTNIIESIYHKNQKMSIYYGDKKIIGEYDKILTTYSSYPKLLAELKHRKTNLKEYHLYIDEAHDAALTSPNFRNEELNTLLESIGLFKNTYMFTGTHIYNCHPVFKDFKVWRFKKESPVEKKLTEVRYRNRFVSIEKRLVRGKLNVVLLQSKKVQSKLGDFMKFLMEKGWERKKIWVINSAQKDDFEYRYMVENEAIKEGVEVLVTTSLIIEGTNLNNTNCATLHFCDFMNAYYIEQFVNRFRIKLPEKIYWYKRHDHESLDEGILSLKDICDATIAKYEKILEVLAVQDHGMDFSEKNIMQTFFGILLDNKIVRKHKNQFELDYLSITSLAVKQEQSYCFNNPSHMHGILQEYSWALGEMENDTETINRALEAQIREDREDRFEAEQQKYREVMERVKGLPLEALMGFNKSADTPLAIDLSSKILYCNKYMELEDAFSVVEKWILYYGFSENAFKTIIKKIKLKYSMLAVEGKKYFDHSHPMIREIKNYYMYLKRQNKNMVFSDDRIKRVFGQIRAKAEKKGGRFKKNDYSLTEMKEILATVLVVEGAVCEDGDFGIKLKGLNYANEIKAEFTLINSAIAKLHQSGLEFDKTYALKLFRAVRSNLGVLGHNILLQDMGPKKAMKMLSLYCDVERRGRSYYVACPGIELLKDVRWRNIEKKTNVAAHSAAVQQQ